MFLLFGISRPETCILLTDRGFRESREFLLSVNRLLVLTRYGVELNLEMLLLY